ncbi:MAG TPA: copper chaperone PCu(A)C [Caulobacteraceae bacterium]|nr:copper chaperone PCu(A)C [Caulobacteraceae bacterium]
MTPQTKRALLAASLLAAMAAAAPAMAADIRITDAWSPPTPPGAPTAAGYLTIRNLEPKPDRLVGGSSPAAAQVQLHSMTMQGQIMRMRAVTGGLAIAGSGTASIQPGSGLHLMLLGLKRPLELGEHVPVTLQFARAGQVRADFVVRAEGAPVAGKPAGGHDHMNMGAK